MMRRLCVIFEGIDGAGKSSFITKLRKKYNEMDVPHDIFIDRGPASIYVYDIFDSVEELQKLEKRLSPAVYISVDTLPDIAHKRNLKRKGEKRYTVKELTEHAYRFGCYFRMYSRLPNFVVNGWVDVDIAFSWLQKHREIENDVNKG